MLGGNVSIMLVRRADPHLGTPMYFLLSDLSFSDICFCSVAVSKMLETLLSERKTISVSSCFAQMFFLLLSGCSEVFILSAMAYDRYASICNPLQYMRTMSCSQLVAGAWLIGSMYALINTLPLSALHLCGPNTINHFSCELPSLVALSCSETFTSDMVFPTSALTIGLVSFSLTLGSYIHILTTILRIRSEEGRHKAFSTCISHLIVVGLFYGTGLFRYFRLNSASSVVLDGLVSIQYSILTPMLNPLIYSLKNKEVKAVLRRLLGGKNHSAPK
ncbi:olfactory receptor 5A1-like [Terrapene carolina triunguis]|uniref:olfactory receptor 5A1-like n=1 Tax=Terrapene triunguis TaxID=2587831 RepID=UPI000E77BE3E|nr:olfactory receptor 5A1-like [Terrapene carolina triunguis]